ncbi:MAG: response regulator [Chloroflexi bacterium]|nr:response regulator [Chloroflexota bacterium]
MPVPRVLIAEDNPDSRELVADILVSLGYIALAAENGQIALDLVLADPPDLVILDVNMPVLDGFAVCQAIKTNPFTAKVPVIMLTAQVDVDSRVMGLGLGADDYLSKPFHPRELVARIQTRLRAKEQADDLRAQREQVRLTFERFVAHEIVEKLLEDPTRIELGGAETIVTVLFADLESFTTVSEYAEPHLLLDVLNQYHALLVERIKSNGGTVDKFLGDGVMALYNTPLPLPDHPLRAVQTALEIREALPTFHERFAPAFRLGINFGIHTGKAIVGNVGAPDLMDFTAIGDTVNLASRLQGLSSQSQITISEETCRLVESTVEVMRVGPRLVRGREEPVVTYLVQGLR